MLKHVFRSNCIWIVDEPNTTGANMFHAQIVQQQRMHIQGIYVCEMNETPSRGVLFGGRVGGWGEDGEMGLGGEGVMGARWAKLKRREKKVSSIKECLTQGTCEYEIQKTALGLSTHQALTRKLP